MSESLRLLGSCATLPTEYWYHVAAQDEMPLAGVARAARVLDELDKKFPTADDYAPGALAVETIAQWLYADPDIAHELRLVLSLSDKRFYLDLSYRLSREIYEVDGAARTLCGCSPSGMKRHTTSAILGFLKKGGDARRLRVSQVIAEYLVGRRLLIVLDLYFGLSQVMRSAVNDLWLAPHDVQQNETKRRGHGAEAEIALALQDAGLSILPANKGTEPMGAADPNISLETFEVSPRDPKKTVSADIALTDSRGALQAMIMGLVQSSDPGQFGVDKAATNGTIRTRLDEHRTETGSNLEIWGIVDGIGYAENPNGTIIPMLGHFHEFIQHNSAYKAVLAASRLGLCKVVAVRYDPDFYSIETATQMHTRYGGSAAMLVGQEAPPAGPRPLVAGRATIWLH
ncbi:hypothetical protein C6I20_07620 [Aeromicrobium sp. A1-2]|uniref:hypothetical protein n=1 Tax=Aeromicrobium sp. A1-2 TaxID=2107713 RepID=UPI000E4F680C|nr:hypothetical protein [Aeromicrobium sp. A1-2]AXT85066.1 hypothetical protein C6I20_07620 [Aeromicrobium sp. A1-2]